MIRNVPKFSIIVPVYNAERYLENCIESVVKQSFKDFEVIFIDDGSTDGSAEICRYHAAVDHRIKFVQTENLGVSHARNIGLKLAVGEYLTFVDSDDILDSGALDSYHNTFLKDEYIDAVRGGYYRVTEGEFVETISLERNYSFEDKSDLFLFMENNRYSSFVWTFCIKRSIIGTLRFRENLTWLEDHIFCYECYLKCKRVALISQPVYHYYIRNSGAPSLSVSLSPEKISEAMDIEYDLKNIINGDKHPELTRQALRCYQWNIHQLVISLYVNNVRGG